MLGFRTARDMEVPSLCTAGEQGGTPGIPVPFCLHPVGCIRAWGQGALVAPCWDPPCSPRARGYPRRLVHLLPDLLHREPDAEGDAVEDVLEVGLLIHLKLGAGGKTTSGEMPAPGVWRAGLWCPPTPVSLADCVDVSQVCSHVPCCVPTGAAASLSAPWGPWATPAPLTLAEVGAELWRLQCGEGDTIPDPRDCMALPIWGTLPAVSTVSTRRRLFLGWHLQRP